MKFLPKSILIENAVLAGALVILAVLIFARLGHYALWDDESMTALSARGVLRTGDTSIWVGNGNFVAYRSGLHVRNFCDRALPPLPAYATAASFALLGQSAWSARLPFALAGLAAIALLLAWARGRGWLFLVVMAMGLIGNVSLILFSRQCRYYAFAVLFSTAIVLIYARAKPTVRNFLVMALVSSLLFSCQYLNYVALYACLGVDYFFWRRKELPATWTMVICLFGPQLLLNGFVASIWNPFATSLEEQVVKATLNDRLTLVHWFWRDANRNEFFSLGLVLVALVLGLVRRRPWLVRGSVALAIFITVTALIAPQIVALTHVADIRYVVPVIPLAIALEAGAICALPCSSPRLAIGLAAIVFGTNLLNAGPWQEEGFRSTLVAYVHELLDPVPEPYTPAADWINANVADGQSVWVLPDYSTYPLMFHAPRALYAWQLDWPPREDFQDMADIHFKGKQWPDYVVAFGPSLGEMMEVAYAQNRPVNDYVPVATIPVYWKDMYRPELFCRTFMPYTNFDPQLEAVYILKRVGPPDAAPSP